MNAEAMLSEYSRVFNDNIEKYIPSENCEYSTVISAAKYSLSAGGKRLRPALVLEFCKMFCGDYTPAIPAAVAIEMIHTYSLIHDDLPCMDDDDIRRGRPSCHVAYAEDIALLAGDGLQALAFSTLANCGMPAEKIVSSISVLAECCGFEGMVGGQVIDLESENKQITLDKLALLHKLKTGKLIEAAVKMGCIFGGASKSDTDLCVKYAKNIGLAFQIRDDILDVIGNEAELGKPIGSDANNMKNTFVSLMSLEAAEKQVEVYTESAKSAISVFGDKAENLCKLADYLAQRKK